MSKLTFARTFGAAFSLVVVLCVVASAQKIDGTERARMKSMLDQLKGEIKKNYYDPNFHGIDLEARFKKAEERLKEIQTTGQGLAAIAQVFLDFDDSHLFFLPPATNMRVEYGWRMQMAGDRCLVYAVKPKSDAAEKGLKVGDQLIAIDGFRPTRKDLWKMEYYYNVLQRKSSVHLTVLSPGDEQPRELDVQSQVRKLPNLLTYDTYLMTTSFAESHNEKHLFERIGGVVVWRMPSFAFEPDQAETLMEQRVNGSSGLVLDLRGNGGGYVKTLERLAGRFFDKDLKIADLAGRKSMDPIRSKGQGKAAYTGKLIVLINSQSGSAAEIFARLIQLEKRGTVIGDVSAGAVMQARRFDGETGSGSVSVFYGASITDADVIMSDGKSVEHTGVIPDLLLLPTGEDLSRGLDPVLSRAVGMLGSEWSPEAAGRFSRYEWDMGL